MVSAFENLKSSVVRSEGPRVSHVFSSMFIPTYRADLACAHAMGTDTSFRDATILQCIDILQYSLLQYNTIHLMKNTVYIVILTTKFTKMTGLQAF